MKQILHTLFIVLILTPVISQNNEKYPQKMKETIDQLYQANTIDELQKAANGFERIGVMEKDQWHPGYYSAFAHIQMASMTESNAEKDKLLDKALDIIKSLKNIEAQNSEILTLEGFLHMLRITIDPATRGQHYSGLSFEALHHAARIDPDNPRTQYVLANMQMGTARFFGQGLEDSCSTLKKAIDLFESSDPKSKLDPTWGLEWAKSLEFNCQGN